MSAVTPSADSRSSSNTTDWPAAASNAYQSTSAAVRSAETVEPTATVSAVACRSFDSDSLIGVSSWSVPENVLAEIEPRCSNVFAPP